MDKTINVRKISFTDRHDTNPDRRSNEDEKKNPAPDPALLLGKSTTNWLKLHELTILLGCDYDTLLCDGSDHTASSGAEAAARGWWTEPGGERPRCDDIVWNATSDESLSDLDDDDEP